MAFSGLFDFVLVCFGGHYLFNRWPLRRLWFHCGFRAVRCMVWPGFGVVEKTVALMKNIKGGIT